MAIPHKILIVEDDPPIQRLIRTVLRASGYKILQTSTGGEGLKAAEKHQPSVIIINRTLPDFESAEIISIIRQSSEVPIIVLCENSEDGIIAMDALANDYIVKPFSKEEVMVRVKKAIVQAAPASAHNGVFKFKDLEVNFVKNTVFRQDKEIHLAPIEFKLLTYFIKSCGKLLSPEKIILGIWGAKDKDLRKCLRVVIRELRLKVEDNPALPKVFTTEIGFGYRFRLL